MIVNIKGHSQSSIKSALDSKTTLQGLSENF